MCHVHVISTSLHTLFLDCIIDKEVYRILFEEVRAIHWLARWWYNIYYLWLQVDEKDVGIVQTFNPSSQGVEKYSYPKAGQKNASTSLKLLEFKFSEDGEVSSIHSTKPHPLNLEIKRVWSP